MALAGVAVWTGQIALAPSAPAATGEHYSDVADAFHSQALKPLPETLNLDPSKVALGQRLFNDPRLSADDTVACSTCHNLAMGGADRQARSRGIGGREGEVNTPTVFNSAFSFAHFWDGRAASLEDQVDGPLHHPCEMGSNWREVIPKLEADPEYFASFKMVYPGGITADNVKDAIATFERSLITPNSRFDRFLRGEVNALSSEEQSGYQMFKSYGCVACHQGVNIGGNMFQTFGVVGDYFNDRGEVGDADLGRFNV
ncbi:MAG: cytochrome B6, partial [Rhizobiales bacterium]|nr:cytochrome B6 [Hyphomicrobiales bacterium]